MSKVKVIVAGPRGRMGNQAVKLVHRTEGFELAAVIDRKYNGESLSAIEGFHGIEAPVFSDINECFSSYKGGRLDRFDHTGSGHVPYRNGT